MSLLCVFEHFAIRIFRRGGKVCERESTEPAEMKTTPPVMTDGAGVFFV